MLQHGPRLGDGRHRGRAWLILQQGALAKEVPRMQTHLGKDGPGERWPWGKYPWKFARNSPLKLGKMICK